MPRTFGSVAFLGLALTLSGASAVGVFPRAVAAQETETEQGAESDTAAAVVAALAQVEEMRASVEERYLRFESEHRHLRDVARGVSDARRDGRTLPDWVTAPATVAAATALADAARAGKADAETSLADALPIAADDWGLWVHIVEERLRAFAVLEKSAAPAKLVVQALLVVADTPTVDAWDGWFQGDTVVSEWRLRNERLATARRVDEASQPTVLVSLEKGRFEVGPWEGWLNDIGAKENKRSKVTVKLLHVDRHEVTCAQYHVYVLSLEPADRAAQLPVGWQVDTEGVPRLPVDRADHPVTGVSFHQARSYAASQGKRLPTEDEWERIATGGSTERVFPWGPEAGRRSWAHKDGGATGTVPVASRLHDVTPEGVLGLAGNVKEMVATTSDRKPVKGRVKDDAKIVLRGGGFRTRAGECRTTWRWFVEAGKSADDVGFRCVMDDAEFRRRTSR